jgi:hypothetical protein
VWKVAGREGETRAVRLLGGANGRAELESCRRAEQAALNRESREGGQRPAVATTASETAAALAGRKGRWHGDENQQRYKIRGWPMEMGWKTGGSEREREREGWGCKDLVRKEERERKRQSA